MPWLLVFESPPEVPTCGVPFDGINGRCNEARPGEELLIGFAGTERMILSLWLEDPEPPAEVRHAGTIPVCVSAPRGKIIIADEFAGSFPNCAAWMVESSVMLSVA